MGDREEIMPHTIKAKVLVRILIPSGIIFLAGCLSIPGQKSELTPMITPNPFVLESAISRSSSSTATIPSPSSTPISTSSQTRTSSPQPTIAPTWTTIPTLVPDKATEILLDLYSNNGSCNLPCWWGITPGKTTWEDTHTTLAPLGYFSHRKLAKDLDMYEFGFLVPENIDTLGLGYFEPTIWTQEGFVSALGLNSGWIMESFDHSLSGILNNYGQPEEIWLKVDTDTMNLPHYELDLFYPHKGILMNSTGNASSINEKAITICPKDFRRGEFPPAILVWDPSKVYTYNKLGSDLLGGSRDIGGKEFQLLREVSTDIDEKEFFRTYQNPKVDKCFVIDLSKLLQ